MVMSITTFSFLWLSEWNLFVELHFSSKATHGASFLLLAAFRAAVFLPVDELDTVSNYFRNPAFLAIPSVVRADLEPTFH